VRWRLPPRQLDRQGHAAQVEMRQTLARRSPLQ
jgi:hypothetical protein